MKRNSAGWYICQVRIHTLLEAKQAGMAVGSGSNIKRRADTTTTPRPTHHRVTREAVQGEVGFR